jgi:hypothetical protein
MFFLKVAKLNKYTCKGPSYKSLFFHVVLCKIHLLFTRMIFQENDTEKCQFSAYCGNIYMSVCAALAQFSVV